MFMMKKMDQLLTQTQWSADGDFIIQYGAEILNAALLFLIGLILVKLFLTWLRKTLPKYTDNHHAISLVMTGLNILLSVLVLSLTLHLLGIRTLVIWRFLAAVALVAIGFVVLLRPYIPSLPFRIGNTIEVNKVIGKVEAVTIGFTRLKTFDGKTLFVPNRMLLTTIINNFHFTPTRRVRVKVSIGYKDDLLKAKKVLKEIMESHPNVQKKPSPAVYVMELGDNGISLSGRCWVENLKYLRVLSDVTEKIKLRFDEEGISIPFPQMDVHVEGGKASQASPDLKAEPLETAVL